MLNLKAFPGGWDGVSEWAAAFLFLLKCVISL
jgi:hypothetical protein